MGMSCRAADMVRTIDAPWRLVGWNPISFKTCSMVISARSFWKSIPGMAYMLYELKEMVSEEAKTVPFPFYIWGTGNGPRRRLVVAYPASGCATNLPGFCQGLQHVSQPLVFDRERVAQLGASERDT